MTNKRPDALSKYFEMLDPDERVIYQLHRSSNWLKDVFDIILAYLFLSASILGFLFLILKVICFFEESMTDQKACEDFFLSDIYTILIPLIYLIFILLGDRLFSIIRRKLVLTNKRILAYNGSWLLERKLMLDLQELQSLVFTQRGIIYQTRLTPKMKLLAKWPSTTDARRLISEFNLINHK
jgi:hypothetical protein